jgi:hypothetical protein
MKPFQFTIKDLLVLTAVVALLAGLLIPAINAARERARRMQCEDNLRQLGRALLHYENQHIFLASAQIIDNNGKISVGGWSFSVRILPYLEWGPLYNSLPIQQTQDPLLSGDPAILTAKQTSIPIFICPSNPNQIFYKTPSGQKEFFTNYKAIGATTSESLRQCINPDKLPPYGDKTMHPDGAFFPGKGISMAELQIDGSGNTVMMTETIDDLHSVWLAGADATLVGIPDMPIVQPLFASYWAPKGFNGKFAEEASPEVKSLRTFLAYDFRPDGKDAGTYPASVGRTPSYGPSSAHPGVVNHLFNDGTVRSLNKDIDCALYFFAITRKGNDPVGPILDY